MNFPNCYLFRCFLWKYFWFMPTQPGCKSRATCNVFYVWVLPLCYTFDMFRYLFPAFFLCVCSILHNVPFINIGCILVPSVYPRWQEVAYTVLYCTNVIKEDVNNFCWTEWLGLRNFSKFCDMRSQCKMKLFNVTCVLVVNVITFTCCLIFSQCIFIIVTHLLVNLDVEGRIILKWLLQK